MAGKGGGSWKVAYADFVTAMMAFFMVMWLTSQDPDIKEAVANYFHDPFGRETDAARGTGAALLPDHTGGLPTDFQGQKPPQSTLDEQDKTKPKLGPRVGVDAKIRTLHQLDERALGELVEFPPDSAELDEQARLQLESVLPQILGKPHKIEIRGYARRRPLPAESEYLDHWQLCYARCMAAMNYLCEHGIEPNRIRLSQAGVYGTRPRRAELEWRDKSGVEVFLLPELVQSTPGRAAEPPPGTSARIE
jgi:chemotaxis protein MotB